MENNRRTTEVDAEIGRRMRTARMALGLSQTELGNRVGVTFQQIQKYEKGATRCAPDRLRRLSTALQKPISYFLPDDEANTFNGDLPSYVADLVGNPVGLSTARAFIRLPRELQARFRDAIVEAADALDRATNGAAHRKDRA